MAIGDRAGRRAALLLAAASLGACATAGLWGAPMLADGRAPVAARTTAAAAPTSGGPHSVPARPSAPASSRPDARPDLTAALAPLVAGMPQDSLSVAALDVTTGQRVTWGASGGMAAASVFKLLLLEGYLLQNQDRGQQPGEGEPDELAAMIENSDNDAADAVYEALDGSGGVTSTLRRLGLSSTVLGADDHWGLSTTSAADQLTLLDDLVSPNSPLSAASRAYALQLTSNVEADQRWGVGAAADPGTQFANKNGWLNVDDDGGRWVVSSVGVIQAHGDRMLLAVLTQHDSDLDSGIALVEQVSRAVAAALAPRH